jgi:hypothetical protein
MNSEDVVAYLQQHPEFFERYADQLAEIYIPHPHGGRTISISERQILTLREKARQLEAKLREIVRFGEENDAIGEKMHRLVLALLGTRELSGTLNALYLNLREDFAVPHVALRLWAPRSAPGFPEFAPVSEAVKNFAAGLAHPYCGPHSAVDSGEIFGESAPRLRSFSYVPLRDGEPFGLLALASEDPKRFYPEMGTLYLTRLGEIIGAALLRHLSP